MSDIDFKKLFEEEFDAENISVSEDLIARTMAAIKAEEDKPENDNTEPAKTDEPVTKIRKKSIIKIIYGIAAALAIGFVGYAVIRFTTLSDKKASDTMTVNTTGEHEKQNFSGADSAKYQGEASDNYENKAEIPMESLNIVVTDSVPMDDGYKAEESGEKENYADDGSNEKSTVESATEVDGQNDTPEDIGSDYTAIPYDELSGSDVEYLVDRLLSEYTQYASFDRKSTSLEECISEIRRCQAYAELMTLEDDHKLDVIYRLLCETGEDGDRELIEAVLIQDIKKTYFNTENGTPVWSSGKEYLELFEQYLNN